MKLSVVTVALVGLCAAANDLSFTYMTLRDGEVSTVTTAYAGQGTTTQSAGPGTTRYEVNPSDLAYPVFPSVAPAIAEAPAASGLPNATDFSKLGLKLITLAQNANATNCRLCQDTMATLQKSLEVDQELLGRIAVPFCKALPFIPMGICVGLFKVGSTDVGAVFGSWAMDMHRDDGKLLCAFLFGLCELPAPPYIDTKKLFKNTTKPAPKTLTPSTKPPLKVLHISDYHLDLRYVVGSEADCTGGAAPTVCCRAFPYNNNSMAIKTPAELFGNYLCDTPEPLGTSVFRNVPKATGHQWSDFAFGLFTGDLVSHDLWELTSEYVLAEELSSYQQFFDGMGGVELYPTLGNHDTFPQAFFASPDENKQLAANASYPIQQAYNLRANAMAWKNYGWLSAADAQSVVASGLGIYRTKTKEGLVIISLNSDIWYQFNLYSYMSGNDFDKTGMLRMLIDYLLEAEERDEPVWVIQHVNIGGSTTYEALPQASDLYYQIIDRFNNTIRATFFGHTHEDEFGVFYSFNGTQQSAHTAAAVAYIGPSVTPYQNLNAGFRYYEVDADTFSIIDSLTYYANISNTQDWTRAGDVTWEFEYSARKTYDPYDKLLSGPSAPLSPAFWHEVTQNIRNDNVTYKTYTDLRTKKYRPYEMSDAKDRQRTLCGLNSMSVPIFETCLRSMDGTGSFL